LVGFVPLPLTLIGMLGVIVALYISTAEIAKHIFYRLVKM
jgi:Mg2+-importing ATPase